MASPLTINEAKRLRGALIYGLCDATGAIFYVGQTRSPKVRFQAHRENKGRNVPLRTRIEALGSELRVVVLQADPADLATAERLEIRSRGTSLLNIIGADDPRWDLQTDRPWAAGTGLKSPSAYALGAARPHVRKVVRARLAGMTTAERCMYELNVLNGFPPMLRARFDRWLSVSRNRMLECMEASVGPA